MKLFLKPSLALLFAASVFMASSCSNDEDPAPTNEEELITTLQLTMVPQGGGTTVTATYRDLDGDGGQAPAVTGAQLAANKTYAVTVQVLDESKTPAEDITEEVEEEGDEHQFFYVVSSGLNLSVAYNDTDSNNRPVGIHTRITTTTASAGNLQVVLKHQPNLKSATSTINTGETDAEVTFPVTIQ
ncbi:type 1 periplasmic binding fold superfamily protein [Rufibacter sp. XAAS-G3-1]|uniref:type 1 periplasmic binding fold superfamily protein n=1 Tax=Rufibacter sp. XAAS-G3-1 TaxID=2729134 RepID=UPI0015E6C73D|nr:type 1 periplasmic binding fold superfamily protein [Rufibacter sp. XAAS-G3-1]